MKDKILDSINETDKPYILVLVIFATLMIGFFLGNLAHDTLFHGIEQSIINERSQEREGK